MALSQEKYNPKEFYESAEFCVQNTTNEERMTWLKHPCTVALVRSLEGDMCGVVSTWLAGGYTNSDSVEATAQMQSHARGIAKAIDDVLDLVQSISKPTEEG